MMPGLEFPCELIGSCLCGGVAYRITGPLRGVVNCFCRQCRKTSGHHVAATRASWESIEFLGRETLRWYESSPGVKRGFCGRCGGNLFWDNGDNNEVSLMAGMLEPPTGLPTVANIHVDDASDYCVIPVLENTAPPHDANQVVDCSVGG